MTDLSKELLDLKDKAVEANTLVDQSKGRLSTYYEQLKDDFGFATVDKANKYYDKELNDIDSETEELEKKVDSLKKKIGSDNED